MTDQTQAGSLTLTITTPSITIVPSTHSCNSVNIGGPHTTHTTSKNSLIRNFVPESAEGVTATPPQRLGEKSKETKIRCGPAPSNLRTRV